MNSTTATELILEFRRTGDNGHARITATVAGQPMHADVLDPGKAADRERFAADLRARCPEVTVEDLDRELLRISGEIGTTTSTSITATTSPWEPIVPLGEYDLPEFPATAIPESLSALRAYCAAVAESYQVPLDLPGMLTLAAGAASLAKKIQVHVRADHFEPVNGYIAVVLDSGLRKSGTFRQVTRPLREFEQELTEQAAPAIHENQVDRAILEARLKEAQNRAAKLSDPNDQRQARDEAHELAEELRLLPTLYTPQLIVDQITPERLTSVLHQQAGRLGLFSPEGDVFNDMAGRYTKEPNLDTYLKAHAGDDIRVGRIGRADEFIREAALTIAITVQPGILQGLMSKPKFRATGLLARFWYSLPQSNQGFRNVAPPAVPVEIDTAYCAMIRAALRLDPLRDDNGQPSPRIVRVSPAGLEQLLDFSREVERGLRPDGEFAGMRDWAGKLVGACARIAGVYHGLIHARTGQPEAFEIDAEVVLCARALAAYLADHAKAAFAEMGSDESIDLARRLVAWLRSSPRDRFKRRDAFMALRARISTVEGVDAPLRLLEDHNYIRPVPVDRPTTGRPPRPVYEVNPEVHAH